MSPWQNGLHSFVIDLYSAIFIWRDDYVSIFLQNDFTKRVVGYIVQGLGKMRKNYLSPIGILYQCSVDKWQNPNVLDLLKYTEHTGPAARPILERI